MVNYSKPETVSLDDIRSRIKTTDLIPSRTALLEDIDAIFDRISQKGIRTWADMQKAIKNPKQLEGFSSEIGIDLQYLVLLRREIEGYAPKPFNLKEIDWVPQIVITRLLENGISNSETLFSKVNDTVPVEKFAEEVGIDNDVLHYLYNLSALSRVQWVSPTTARMLIEAGYATCQQLASADKDELFASMDRVNKKGKYFNGTIGLRDIKRLIDAARYAI
jgi:hypothetical protein